MPELPEDLVSACEVGDLVVFVGAGVSRLLGAPSWPDFADAALRAASNQGCIDPKDLDGLIKGLDPKQKLSLARIYCEERGVNLDLRSILEATKKDAYNICKDLVSIGTPIVTTNYDDLLDSELARTTTSSAQEPASEMKDRATASRKIYFRPEEFTRKKLLDEGAIIHLHGSIKDPSSMIVTTDDYLRHYSNTTVQKFLSELFELNTVLFLGYGLSEIEILEFVFQKANIRKRDKPIGYWLNHCTTDRDNLASHVAKYYRKTFNVEMLKYYVDGEKYERLVKVVETWTATLKARRGGTSFMKKLDFIKEITE